MDIDVRRRKLSASRFGALRDAMKRRAAGALRDYTVEELASSLRMIYVLDVHFDPIFSGCFVGRLLIDLRLLLPEVLLNFTKNSGFHFSMDWDRGVIDIEAKVSN